MGLRRGVRSRSEQGKRESGQDKKPEQHIQVADS